MGSLMHLPPVLRIAVLDKYIAVSLSISLVAPSSTIGLQRLICGPVWPCNNPSQQYIQRRHAHSRRHVSYAISPPDSHSGPIISPSVFTSSSISSTSHTSSSPLSILPLPHLLRSYLISSISSSPLLLRSSVAILKLLVRSRSPVLNPDRNPILHYLLKKTVYAQFCAGETAQEVKGTIERLKGMGYQGVMLCYAREVVGEKGKEEIEVGNMESNLKEAAEWADGTLRTVKMAQEGDFVAVKFSGSGKQTLIDLRKGNKPSESLQAAITQICEEAQKRRVKLAFDAEQDAVQAGIDAWTLDFMRRYNTHGKALVYGTYQAYKKACPEILARHMEIAYREGFALGVKLVRGAYLGSDPRHLFWDTAEQTHNCYDSLASSLMQRTYNHALRPASPTTTTTTGYPSIDLFLGGHNGSSVSKAQTLRNAQVQTGQPRIELAYGQLLGMAENISCDLVHAGQRARARAREEGREQHRVRTDIPRAYQYVVWGSVAECSQYLVRRAEENTDAVARTLDAKKALGRDLVRRLGLSWLL